MTNTAEPTPTPTLRAISTATIAFGLVVCPVKLYSSTSSDESGISFHMHHDRDSGRLKQQYICTVCGEVVDRDHTVKGYEHAKGQSVMLTATELAALDAVATNQIAIETYVPLAAVDPRFYEKTYYLGPDKGGDKAYAIIAQALIATSHVAIAMYARRGTEKLVLVRAVYGADLRPRLVLHELHYANEIRSADGVPVGAPETSPSMLDLAADFVQRSAVETFDPSTYRDKVHDRVMTLIEQKVDGGEIVVAPEPAGSAPADLLEALRASLDVAPKRTVTTPKRTRKQRVQAIAAKKRTIKPKRKAAAR